jgi:hypothetical protein
MRYQILKRSEIEDTFEYDDELPAGEEFQLFEDGDVYVLGGDGHILFTDCVFPDPYSDAAIEESAAPPTPDTEQNSPLNPNLNHTVPDLGGA